MLSASTSVLVWTTLASAMSYEPFGAVKTVAYGNGLAAINDWGNDGRLASRRLYRSADSTNLSYLAYRYDGNDNIAAIADQLGTAGSVVYGYDRMDRLTQTLINTGAAPGTVSYSYSAGTNRLAAVNDSAGTRAITYDGRGNTAVETRPGAVSATTAYDGYGRLTGYNRSDVGALAFGYNGLDDRVAMSSPWAGPRAYVYDGAGRVVGEYGASAVDVKAEFIWLSPQAANDNLWGGDDGLGGYMPLAVATPDAGGTVQLNWIYGNHLGVPVLTTDALGNPATTPNDYLLPGFPGQSRVLADLYYNRYRDYDPSTGRYIQADPIGLAGGSNVFGYAGANPVNRVDPSGMIAQILGGAAVGAGVELGFQAYGNYRNGCDIFNWRNYNWRRVGKGALYGAALGGVGKWAGNWVELTNGSMKWVDASRRIRRAEDLVGKQVDLHHWALPRKWGDGVGGLRDKIVNHPWNLNLVPRAFHQDVLNPANPFMTIVRGAPDPLRAAAVAGAAGAAIDADGQQGN